MKSNAQINDDQTRLSRLFSYLKPRSTALCTSLIFVCVLSYCDLQGNNDIDTFAKALEYNMYEDPEERNDHFSYYGSSSVFSNLSRGLPVDAEIPSPEAETLNEQQQEQKENPNTNGEDQE